MTQFGNWFLGFAQRKIHNQIRHLGKAFKLRPNPVSVMLRHMYICRPR